MTTVTTAEVAKALSITRKSVIERAKRERWEIVDLGQNTFNFNKEKLPSDIQILLTRTAYAPVKKGNEPDENPFFVNATEKERKVAQNRKMVINAYLQSSLKAQDFVVAYNSGDISPSMFKVTGSLSYTSFMRWLRSYQEGQKLDALVPKYSRSRVRGGSGESLTEAEKSTLEYFYLNIVRRTISHCYLATLENIPHSRATYQTCYRYLKGLNPDVVDFYRLGRDKFEAKHFAYIRRNKLIYRSLEQVQGDHHILDRVVKKNGKVMRPWLTSFIDFRSGAILGWCVSTNPCARTIAASYYMMVTLFGIPNMIHVDNGKDYRSNLIKGSVNKAKTIDMDGIEHEEEAYIAGIASVCGSFVSYARAYHGQSKGVQERFYGILEEYYSKNTGNYVGSNTASRVDEMNLYWRKIRGQEKRDDITEWADFVKEITTWLDWYNSKWVSQAEGREGKTPMETFVENLPEQVKKPDMKTLELCATSGTVKRVRENGVRIGRSDYFAKELLHYTGTDVIVRQKLVKPEEALICDIKGRLICTAKADYLLESGDMEKDNEQVNSLRREKLKIVRGRYTPPLGHTGRASMLQIAMESSGVELPSPANFAPIEEENLQQVAGAEKPANSHYKSYYDMTDKERL